MYLASLRRVGRLFGPAALLALGCGRVVVDSGGESDATGSTGADGGASTGSTGGGDGGSSTTESEDTTVTDPPCEPVQLADVVLGIGGFALDGEAVWDHAGYSVAAAGDVNGDGLADVVIGARQADANGLSACGRAYVVYGKADTSLVLLSDVALGIGGFAMDGEAELDKSGWSVGGAGDMDGDGFDDVVVGAPWADANGVSTAGRSYLVFGKAETERITLADVALGVGGFAMDGDNEDDWAGKSVGGAGDVNGDGLLDVVVGAPKADPSGPHSGRTYVVFGTADMERVSFADVAQGAGGFAVDGEAEGDYSGWSLSGAGDVNGDGLADLIVGAFRKGPQAPDHSGRSYVVLGKADTENVALVEVAQGIGGFALQGDGESFYFRHSVSGAGDVNGDGLADIVVGEPAVASDGGRAYVVFGRTNTDKVTLADVALGIGGFALDGEAAGDLAGSSVGGAGDVNGDGLADIVVGARGAGPNGHVSGRTYVVFGKEDGSRVSLADVALGIGGFALDGEADGDQSGTSVNGASDVNGDGLADVVVGAPNSDRAYVVFGGDLSCAER